MNNKYVNFNFTDKKAPSYKIEQTEHSNSGTGELVGRILTLKGAFKGSDGLYSSFLFIDENGKLFLIYATILGCEKTNKKRMVVSGSSAIAGFMYNGSFQRTGSANGIFIIKAISIN